jgi:hypothetical protein
MYDFVISKNKMVCYDGDNLIAISTNEVGKWNSIDIDDETYDLQIVDDNVRMYLVFENGDGEFVINENEYTTHSLTYM